MDANKKSSILKSPLTISLSPMQITFRVMLMVMVTMTMTMTYSSQLLQMRIAPYASYLCRRTERHTYAKYVVGKLYAEVAWGKILCSDHKRAKLEPRTIVVHYVELRSDSNLRRRVKRRNQEKDGAKRW